MQLKPVSFEKETDIRHEFQLETSGNNRFCYTLIAKFSGTYRYGSAGKPDANFICGITQTAITMWHPAALILDLRELSYTWGDEMDCILSLGENMPTAVVGSERCLPAIGTLLYGLSGEQAALDLQNIFDNFEAAWEHIRKHT